MELKCLQHLDAPNSWDILRTAKPSEDDVLAWRPFRRVFGFNWILFSVVFVSLFFILEKSGGMGWADIREDMPYGLSLMFVLATGFAAYVTYLYRRSWNNRARLIRRQFEDAAI